VYGMAIGKLHILEVRNILKVLKYSNYLGTINGKREKEI
jgi:hypothetical protein